MNLMLLGFFLFVAILNIAEYIDDKANKNRPEPTVTIIDGRVYDSGGSLEKDAAKDRDSSGGDQYIVPESTGNKKMPEVREEDDPM